jgi:hypothetical protein
MKWEEVRKIYPNTFVKFEVVESHMEEDKEVVDEGAFIKTISNGKQAMKEHLNCKKGQYVRDEQTNVRVTKAKSYSETGLRNNLRLTR